MPLGIEVGLGPFDIVLDEDPPHQLKGAQHLHFQAMISATAELPI